MFSNGVPERFNQVHGTQPTEIWWPFYYLVVLTSSGPLKANTVLDSG